MSTAESSIVVVAHIRPLPEHRADVMAAFVETIERVHAEDAGCELYALHAADEDADEHFVIVEKWSDADMFRLHGEGPALSALRERLGGKLAGPLEVTRMRPIPAGDTRFGAI